MSSCLQHILLAQLVNTQPALENLNDCFHVSGLQCLCQLTQFKTLQFQIKYPQVHSDHNILIHSLTQMLIQFLSLTTFQANKTQQCQYLMKSFNRQLVSFLQGDRADTEALEERHLSEGRALLEAFPKSDWVQFWETNENDTTACPSLYSAFQTSQARTSLSSCAPRPLVSCKESLRTYLTASLSSQLCSFHTLL